MQNIKSVISNHNMKVLNNTVYWGGPQLQKQEQLPSRWKMLHPKHHLRITDDVEPTHYKQKIYIGTTETDFKHRFNNHTKSFRLEHYENDTEPPKEYSTIKRNHFTPIVTWRIMRKCAPFNTTKRKCYLCLHEKLEIAPCKGDNLLNKRSELNTKCRHHNKFTLLRHDIKG